MLALETTAVATSELFSQEALVVLSTLIYFDIFNYPLTTEEIFERSNINSLYETEKALKLLVSAKAVFLSNGFYTVRNDNYLSNRRTKSNKKAKQYIRIAKIVASVIRHFPYVRSAMLSGSVSKMCADKKSDIDYFIITEPGRLWITRFLFILVQKFIFFNSVKFFCYNYMIDSNHLQISNRSFYNAIEIVTLVPVYNGELYKTFLEKNKWSNYFFPNYPQYDVSKLPNKNSLFKKVTEAMLNNKLGEWLDKLIMRKAEQTWKRKFPAVFNKSKELKLSRHTAKAHTKGHYSNIMNEYEAKLKAYEHELNIAFNKNFIQYSPITIVKDEN
jgi:hypothetical protein